MRSICEDVSKPLRPIWVTPQSKLHQGVPARDEEESALQDSSLDSCQGFLEDVQFFPLVCVSVSDPEKDGLPLAIRLSESSPSTSFVYVQGAADDEETWARVCLQATNF